MSEGQTPGLGDNQPPATPLLPGEILNTEFLSTYHVSPPELDDQLDLTPGTTQAIVDGRRRVTGWMSQLLGRSFGVADAYFSDLQEQYDTDASALDEQEEHESEHRFALADKLASRIGRTIVKPEAAGPTPPLSEFHLTTDGVEGPA